MSYYSLAKKQNKKNKNNFKKNIPYKSRAVQ